MKLDLPKIRQAARANRTEWRYHALLRCAQRGITQEEVLRVMQEGEVLEEHPFARPFPKCLMMAMVEPGKPLYVSVGYDQDNDRLHIITVHWRDPRKWEDPCTRSE